MFKIILLLNEPFLLVLYICFLISLIFIENYKGCKSEKVQRDTYTDEHANRNCNHFTIYWYAYVYFKYKQLLKKWFSLQLIINHRSLSKDIVISIITF